MPSIVGARLQRVCSVPDRTRSRLDMTGNTEFVYYFRLFWCIITFHSTIHNAHAWMHTKQWPPREKFSTWKSRFLDTFQKVVRVTTTGILLSKVSRVDVANKIAVPKSRNEIFLGGLFSGLAHGLLWYPLALCRWNPHIHMLATLAVHFHEYSFAINTHTHTHTHLTFDAHRRRRW